MFAYLQERYTPERHGELAGPGNDRFLNAGHLRGCGARFGGERGSAGLRRAASGLAPPASGQGAGRSHHLEELGRRLWRARKRNSGESFCRM